MKTENYQQQNIVPTDSFKWYNYQIEIIDLWFPC